MHLRSKGFWPLVVAGLLILGSCSVGGVQQLAAQQTTPSTSQPSLTVDRDPVPSPDVDPPPQPATGAPQGIGLGPIKKDPGGKYTLRTDAYEVRLNEIGRAHV